MPIVGFAADSCGDGRIIGKKFQGTQGQQGICDCFPVQKYGSTLVWKVPPSVPPKDFVASVLSLFLPTVYDAICTAEAIVAKFGVGEIKFLYAVFDDPPDPCIWVQARYRIEDLERRGLLCFTASDSRQVALEGPGPTRT